MDERCYLLGLPAADVRRDATVTGHARKVLPGERSWAECAERTADLELTLPLTVGSAAVRATHVVVLRGDHEAFRSRLREAVAHDAAVARALCAALGALSLGQLADLLNEVGDATVQSIDRV